jgi:hypothetical protein
MKKFAYLIMAHENSFVLKTLLQLLDDERNDIYIHFDAKIQFNFKNELICQVTKSRLYFTDKRQKVGWADISQVKAEYLLYEAAYNQYNYSYYHLISGSDLPIKSQNFIHSFFESMNGEEFISYSNNNYIEKVRYIYIFSKYFRSKANLFHLFSKIFIYTQCIFNFNRLKGSSFTIMKGSNWVSVTNSFVEYLIENKNELLELFKYAKSPDEYYKQTLAYNSTFNQNVFSKKDDSDSCLREIDWKRGCPYVWKNNDFDFLIKSEKLFARKFSDSEIDIVLRIRDYVVNNN